MKLHSTSHRQQQGLTLIEVTLVIGVLIGLASVTVLSIKGMSDWRKGRSAGEDLRSVYIAQKSYLSDNPTADISSVSSADLAKYLPSGMVAIPTVEDLDGSNQSIDHSVMPPVIGSAGSVYDPSPKTDDGVWDVGKK